MSATSWRAALFGGSAGFQDHPYWYDLHIAADPVYAAAVREVVRAAPPPDPGAEVADLGAGTGALMLRFHNAYPLVRPHLIEPHRAKLSLAKGRLELGGVTEVVTHQEAIDPQASKVMGSGGYSLIISSLALHVIAGERRPPDEYAERHRGVMRQVLASLAPGGVFVYAEGVWNGLGVREHLGLLEDAGFRSVDCAWRSGQLLVCGGQRP